MVRSQLILLLLAPQVTFAADVVGSKNLLEPQLIGDETYTEKYVAFADLSDGTYVQVLFGISNVGSGDGNGACKILVVEPNRTTTDDKVVDREGWQFTKTPSPKLTIGNCVATVGDTLEMVAPLDKATVRLVLKAKPVRIPAHAFRDDGDFYDLEIIVPWAPAEVTLQTKAGERTLSGFGYADHGRSKILPGDLARRWVRFRSFDGKTSRLILVRYPSDKDKKPVGWYRQQPDLTAHAIERVMMKPGPQKGKARSWRILLDGGDRGQWRITSDKLLYRYAPMEQHGMLGAMAGAFIGKPVTFTYRAVLEDRQKRERVKGLLEIALIDQ